MVTKKHTSTAHPPQTHVLFVYYTGQYRLTQQQKDRSLLGLFKIYSLIN